MNSFSTFLREGNKHLWTLLFLVYASAGFAQLYTDAALQQTAFPPVAQTGDTITYTIQVINQGATNLTGLTVKNNLPLAAHYLSHTAPAGTTFSSVNGFWNIGNSMTANVAQLELEIKAIATLQGVLFNRAEIFTLSQTDVDSKPGNTSLLEDDIAGSCVSVPFTICPQEGNTVTLEAPAGLIGYAWYRDGGNGPEWVSSDSVFIAEQGGSYTFAASLNACQSGSCCPVIIEEQCAGAFDLSLNKTLAPGQPQQVDLEDEVHYQLVIKNEGTITTSHVEISDFLPVGMALSANNNGWILLPSGAAVFVYNQPLAPGDSAVVDIVLQVLYGASGQSILNTAEITAATDSDGAPLTDIDSTPDNGTAGEDDTDGQEIELIPHDPTGYIYCASTGELVAGGAITVTGPGQVFMISDGSNGYYEFFTDGTPGIYNLAYTPPAGYQFNDKCLPQPGSLDPTGLPDPFVLGADTISGYLENFDCVANPYYLSFELEPGDPFIFNNNLPMICPNPPVVIDIFPEDSVTISVNCDMSDPLFCLNVPYAQLTDYAFTLNGQPYVADFDPCDYPTDRYYIYDFLLGFGNEGPYKLEYWSIQGEVHSADFQSFTELLSLMNDWDDKGNWTLDPAAQTISGGHPYTWYSQMIVRHLPTGAIAFLELNKRFAEEGSALEVPEGESVLVITRLTDGVSDTVNINVVCLSPDYVDLTLPVGQSDTICLNTDELQGGVVSVFNPCSDELNQTADFELIAGTNCIEITGTAVGQVDACYVVCDHFGICDTTYISVSVINDGLMPDSLCTLKDHPVDGNILANDNITGSIQSVTILTPPQHGNVIVNPDFSVTYTPDPGFCTEETDEASDEFFYQVCTTTGCQSTRVAVLVPCDGLVIYNAFSPNGDQINDFFKIEGLEKYPRHEVIVFNRWGNRVFRSQNYKSDWDGTWDGKHLPDGTYFYLIHLEEEKRWLSGYVQLNR
jgi:gliding motility-associated-like protein/uncharacterized repeat protein (TIGR01451 family)